MAIPPKTKFGTSFRKSSGKSFAKPFTSRKTSNNSFGETSGNSSREISGDAFGETFDDTSRKPFGKSFTSRERPGTSFRKSSDNRSREQSRERTGPSHYRQEKERAPKNQVYEIVYGIHSVTEVLAAKKRRVYQIYTTSPMPKALVPLKKTFPLRAPVTIVKRDVLDRMAGTTDHQGVVITVAAMEIRRLLFDPKKEPFIVLVDGVQDTRNLGAIVRSAHCTGVNGIVVPHRECCPLNASTHKASAGLIEHMPIYQPTTAYAAAAEIKKQGYHVYMAALGGKRVTDVEFKFPACIVIGNEAQGISPKLLSLGEKIMLPQRTPDISYNASVAAGIMLFWVATKNGII